MTYEYTQPIEQKLAPQVLSELRMIGCLTSVRGACAAMSFDGKFVYLSASAEELFEFFVLNVIFRRY